jgi:DNA (cytosine-5)-methyltransferase 1
LPTTIELCAGGGGQAIGLELSGYKHIALIENDKFACQTLRLNRPTWNVVEHDLFCDFDLSLFKGVDLIAGGLPCPPFSIAGGQLGEKDERNLFSVGLNYVDAIRPKAVMFENVKGLLEPRFRDYREHIDTQLTKMGYCIGWRLLQASEFGVPQLRPRVILIAVEKSRSEKFIWPSGRKTSRTVGSTLHRLMKARGWQYADQWRDRANTIAPTIVGGSKKHGGADLGPTRSKAAWAQLSVDGFNIAEAAPDKTFRGMPQLTIPMVARLQGFPSTWKFSGKKTAAYRQIGNAFPHQVAKALGIALMPVFHNRGK